MKKIVSLILTLITAFSLCACGMTNDGYVTASPDVSAMPSTAPAPGSANGGTVNGNGSGSVIDDSTLVSPSPMPTASVSSPAPTDASGTSTPAESAKPSENPTK